MKKFLLAILAMIFSFGILVSARADVTTSPSTAKVGDKITITIKIDSMPAKADKVYLYISDTLPKNPEEGTPYLKAAYDASITQQGKSASYTYTWDTKAAGSTAGVHNIVVFVADKDKAVLFQPPVVAYTLTTATTTTTDNQTNQDQSTNDNKAETTSLNIADLGTITFWPTKVNNLGELITVIINWLLGLIGAAAVVAVVYSGIMYITASADPTKAETAKKNLTWAIIGIILVALSFVIVQIVAKLISGK